MVGAEWEDIRISVLVWQGVRCWCCRGSEVAKGGVVRGHLGQKANTKGRTMVVQGVFLGFFWGFFLGFLMKDLVP